MLEKINDILRQEDIEGIIHSGAPSDEYMSEAKDIAGILVQTPLVEINLEKIIAIVSFIWINNFDLSVPEMNDRLLPIRTAAKKILKAINDSEN